VHKERQTKSEREREIMKEKHIQSRCAVHKERQTKSEREIKRKTHTV
jgi:hypothetical protein